MSAPRWSPRGKDCNRAGDLPTLLKSVGPGLHPALWEQQLLCPDCRNPAQAKATDTQCWYTLSPDHRLICLLRDCGSFHPTAQHPHPPAGNTQLSDSPLHPAPHTYACTLWAPSPPRGSARDQPSWGSHCAHCKAQLCPHDPRQVSSPGLPPLCQVGSALRQRILRWGCPSQHYPIDTTSSKRCQPAETQRCLVPPFCPHVGTAPPCDSPALPWAVCYLQREQG